MGSSCHGSRIDCFGWGENIDTTGDGSLGNLTNSYTTGFGGTSGASAMVAGAAVLLQSWRQTRRSMVYSPDILRALLSSTRNTASASPATDRIGVMPNLRAIIETEMGNDRWRPIRDNYVSWVYILFGLVDDTPGVIWIPGRGPVPVDPDWLPISKIGAGPARDLIAALMVSEITRTIDDPATKAALNDAAVDAMRGAVERLVRLR